METPKMKRGVTMDDGKIIDLYFGRSEKAISASDEKYGKYCYHIAYNVLYSELDSKDCVNETWLLAWNKIPPEKPRILKAFFACITRNLALNRLDYNTARKRRLEISALMDEFWECVPSNDALVEDEIIMRDLINGYLKSLDKRTRVIFMRRYFYGMSVSEIAKSASVSPTHVSVILYRARRKFKDYLEKRGVLL
jgi:RNA polymerase sigma-70 factor (ECF subfamily)